MIFNDLTIDELSKYTGIHERSLQRWARDHDMPHSRSKSNSRDIRVNRPEFLRWICTRGHYRSMITRPDAQADCEAYWGLAMHRLLQPLTEQDNAKNRH